MFIEGIVDVAPKPSSLRDGTEIVWELSIFIWRAFVSLTNWIEFFVEFGVDNSISEVVVRFALMSVVLRRDGGVKVENRSHWQ
jgi:hypothetical protein